VITFFALLDHVSSRVILKNADFLFFYVGPRMMMVLWISPGHSKYYLFVIFFFGAFVPFHLHFMHVCLCDVRVWLHAIQS